uniref:Uncharacterized protein n=1 Tax=Strongyloides papillosus TaxID=174720 RepID=A0A0N5C0D6_STREA
MLKAYLLGHCVSALLKMVYLYPLLQVMVP